VELVIDMMFYRVFDIAVKSDCPLAGIAVCTADEADLTVETCHETAVDEQGFEWIHQWKSPDDVVTIACAKRGDEYLLRFPRIADFHIRPAAHLVRVFPGPNSPKEIIAQMLLDQVIPRLLFHKGRMVMHASAVVLSNGLAVAFLGNSGLGKSTLAASFHRSGARLVTDDCLLLEKRGSSLVGIPAYPSLRLWPDSMAALLTGTGRYLPVAHDTGKFRMTVDSGQAGKGPVPLSALFILGESSDAPANDAVQYEPVRGNTVMMAMIESAFVLDLVSREVVRRNFEVVGEVAQAGLPVYTLNYSRRYALLPKVRAIVEKLVCGGGNT
jgi:hypothetical protein